MVETKKYYTKKEELDNYISKFLTELALIYYPELYPFYKKKINENKVYKPFIGKMVFNEIVIMHDTKDGEIGGLAHYMYPTRDDKDSRSNIKDADKLIRIFNKGKCVLNNSFIEIEDGHGTTFDLLIKIKGYYIFLNHTFLSVKQIKDKGENGKWETIIDEVQKMSVKIESILHK
ncbi:MAG: hypothetical protein U9Q66_01065 [Patescibacteria group bacterium]|nr:hypothetical protein [Patescibacteria group bacterium]